MQATYNELGYRIFDDDGNLVYERGNCRGDSVEVLEINDPHRLDLSTIRENAETMIKEYGGGPVKYEFPPGAVGVWTDSKHPLIVRSAYPDTDDSGNLRYWSDYETVKPPIPVNTTIINLLRDEPSLLKLRYLKLQIRQAEYLGNDGNDLASFRGAMHVVSNSNLFLAATDTEIGLSMTFNEKPRLLGELSRIRIRRGKRTGRLSASFPRSGETLSVFKTAIIAELPKIAGDTDWKLAALKRLADEWGRISIGERPLSEVTGLAPFRTQWLRNDAACEVYMNRHLGDETSPRRSAAEIIEGGFELFLEEIAALIQKHINKEIE